MTNNLAKSYCLKHKIPYLKKEKKKKTKIDKSKQQKLKTLEILRCH